MSMQSLAQAVQSQGRGNDTMLVHMTPKEVGGLQNLANNFGGSLTTNPSTGLPEAGFLDAILPAVAGAALTIGSGGLINPLTAGAIVGGGTAAITGDVGKGLTAGLGAFGGGSLGGLAGAGGAGMSTIGAATPTGLQTAGASLSNLAAAPAGQLATAGLAAASPALAQAAEQPQMGGGSGSQTMIRPFQFNPGATGAERENRGTNLGSDTGEKTYFRPTFTPLEPFPVGKPYGEGGIVNLNVGGMPGMTSPTPPSRFLRGVGDGVSDSIPATVNQGERPAALSDGEYVIDARGVAEIGNGSSEAGARKLTEMMNRIHSARRKADKGEDMNADRFLLA